MIYKLIEDVSSVKVQSCMMFITFFLLNISMVTQGQTLIKKQAKLSELKNLEVKGLLTTKQEKQLNTLEKTIPRLRKISVLGIKKSSDLQFVGNGNIQKAIDNSGALPASTGLGVTFSQQYDTANYFDFYKIELDGFINVASTVDTVHAKLQKLASGFAPPILTNHSEFGSSALTPLNSGQAVSLDIRGFFTTPKLGFISGVRIKYNSANRYWEDSNLHAMQVTLNAFRAGVFHEFLPTTLRETCSISIGAAFAFNTIKGDIGLASSNKVRSDILNSAVTSFYGYELNTILKLKNIRAEFGYIVFMGDDIPGLTGGRLVTTISFVGGFSVKE